jgi:hypothetical protein
VKETFSPSFTEMLTALSDNPTVATELELLEFEVDELNELEVD